MGDSSFHSGYCSLVITKMIDFDDNKHRYSYRNVTYISATQLVGLYSGDFDTAGAAIAVAEKRGGTDDYWKNEWKQINSTSLVRGNALHDAKEEVVQDRQVHVVQGKVFPVYNRNLFRHTNYIEYPDGAYPELILWNHKYKIAGKSDLVTFSTRNYKRYAFIHDYKSNKVIRETSYIDLRTKKYTMMKHPIQHLMACTYVEYNLQLSIYAFMLEKMGFIIEGLSIEHYPHVCIGAPPGAKEPKPVIYNMKYLKNDVLSILNHLRRA